MVIRYLPALFALLAAFSLHAAGPAGTGTYYGAKTTEYPAWFKTSFLDLKEDVDEATQSGKRVILMQRSRSWWLSISLTRRKRWPGNCSWTDATIVWMPSGPSALSIGSR